MPKITLAQLTSPFGRPRVEGGRLAFGRNWGEWDSKIKRDPVLPFVTYPKKPLMTSREWVACGIGVLVGAGIVWFIRGGLA